jgi:hypothetical protein
MTSWATRLGWRPWAALTRSTDALLRRKNQRRLIIDLDTTEYLASGKQDVVAYNGHFAKNCFHKTIWLQKKETYRVDTREEISPKPFFTAVAKVAA